MTTDREDNENEKNNGDNVYETTASLSQYLSLHYPLSGQAEGIPAVLPHDGDHAPTHALGFPRRAAQLLVRLMTTTTTMSLSKNKNNDDVDNDNDRQGTQPLSCELSRALDIGCAVGGSSFALAEASTVFGAVDAFDNSGSFIDAANRMKSLIVNTNEKNDNSPDRPEPLMFEIPMEGELGQRVAAANEPTTTAQVASKVRFFVGDACKMKEMIRSEHVQKEGCVEPTPPLQVSLHRHGYRGILMSNLLCRLPDPMACLEASPLLVQPGSVVLILTPFTWLTEFTPKERWLGGYYEEEEDGDDGSSQISKIMSKDTLESVMEGLGFCKIHEEQIPMLIRKHQRKYQFCISEATGWRKE